MNKGNGETLFAEERRRQRFCIYVDRAVWSIKAIITLEKTYMKGKFFGKFLIAQDLDLK